MPETFTNEHSKEKLKMQLMEVKNVFRKSFAYFLDGCHASTVSLSPGDAILPS
jgi:hypothetical protein